ncbi:MAG: TraB/GumN family protein [Gammaproteobacteria bacterium]|nr:TraB/GumN family protein [Gammaproteobacteria bacterium]
MPERLTPVALIALLLVLLAGSLYVSQRPAPFSEGVFWQVSKDGEIVGHILGTIHSNDERVTRIPKRVMDVFTNASAYAIEAFPGSELWNPYHGLQNIRGRMMLPGKQTLAEVAGEKLAQKVYTILKGNYVDEEFARRVKPWAAIHSLAIKSEHQGPIVDQKLLDLAVLQDKELYQIESPEELLAAFYAMPMDSQVSLLQDKLRAFPEMRNTMEEIVLAYGREDLQAMMDLSTSFTDKDPSKRKHHEIYVKHAIDIRSVVMTHYMGAAFREGNVFIAVGALHLFGKNGVLSLLGQEFYGEYEVERIPIK